MAARNLTAGFGLVALAVMLAGCAALGLTRSAPPLSPAAVESPRYYPYLVKGYQGSFPYRRILVLAPVDARAPGNRNLAPLNGRPAIGVISDRTETMVQRLYSDPLAPIVQQAIAHSAEEAGLRAIVATEVKYDPRQRGVDYVLTSTITRCWVKKHRVPVGSGPAWRTNAEFALRVTLYKPPFGVPFWQGTSAAEYDDPPLSGYGLGSGDGTSIYERPSEDLSVAMTRAVAGIFERPDLRTLILEDHIVSH